MATFRFRARPGRRLWPFLTATATIVVLMLTIVSAASSGPVGIAAGFEDDDGNLAPEAPINFDWNSFAPTTWTGTAPTRTSSKIVSGWAFTGLEDAEKSTSDSNFAGGTKQDIECPSVGTGSASNKDDLKRVYFASKTVAGHIFLELAWVRTAQNTTSSSAHVAFEFNQGTTACGAGSDALVHRSTANGGDMLIVYDFEGGAGSPTIKLERWIASGACEVSTDSPPCWSVAQNLTASGFAEAKVNTGITVTDNIAPSPPESLGDSEFGETGIDLTGAGVFPANVCVAFGKGYAVSRSSGNSAQAQMKDLAGPGNLNINNCGEIIIRKHTDPRGKDKTFSYTSNLPANSIAGGVACPGNSGPGIQADGSFCLNDAGNSAGGESPGNTVDTGQIVAKTYTVTEGADPSGFTFESLSCTAGTTSGKTATINLAPGDKVTCTYVNQLNTATMSTTPSNTSNPVVPGNAVHDTATVTGNQSTLTPSGTVTFFLCSFPAGSTSTCDGTTNVGVNIGTGTLSGSGATATATSPDVNTSSSPLAAGHYCFRAEWPGDTNYPAALSFDGSNECFDVTTVNSQTVTTPSRSTILLGAIKSGSFVTDNAVISPVTDVGQVTGTVNFFICGPIATGTCTSGGTAVGTNVTCSPAGSGHACQATSDPVGSSIITTVGRYCFRAEYSGDSKYNPSSDSGTVDSECFTVTDTSSVVSTQSWVPNDTATASSDNGSPLNGTLTVQLYNGTGCVLGSEVSGHVYTKTVSGNTTSSTISLTTTNADSFTSDVSWLVTFASSDPNVASAVSHCENSTLTVTN
jgi:hypothetical protein